MKKLVCVLFAVLAWAPIVQACTCPDSLSMADRGYTMRVVPSPTYSTLTIFVEADSSLAGDQILDSYGAFFSVRVYNAYPSTNQHPGDKDEWLVTESHVYPGNVVKVEWKIPSPFEGAWTIDVSLKTTLLRVKLR